MVGHGRQDALLVVDEVPGGVDGAQVLGPRNHERRNVVGTARCEALDQVAEAAVGPSWRCHVQADLLFRGTAAMQAAPGRRFLAFRPEPLESRAAEPHTGPGTSNGGLGMGKRERGAGPCRLIARTYSVLGVMALVAGGVGIVTSTPAGADLPSACTLSGSTVTCTWTSGSHQFGVPGGVSSLHVLAVGGKGGSMSLPTIAGGFGAEVTGDVTVTPGSSVWVVVGGNGGAPIFPTPGLGGANGGGGGGGNSSRQSAGGGGASDVRTSQTDLTSRLVVAGGGGGAGSSGGATSGDGAPGGAAGSGGGTGTDVITDNANGDATGGGGGGPGTASAGGAGGAGGTRAGTTTNGSEGCPGAPGALGQGGDGGLLTGPFCAAGGGGGGGGVYGGGGGGGGASIAVAVAGSGGGGGGSSLVPAGGSIQTDTTGTPKVVISYTAPETLGDVSAAINGPTSAPAGSQNTYVVTVANAGPGTARNVVMATSVPSGTKLVGVSTTRGMCAAPRTGATSGTITCALGDLAAGAEAKNSVALKITLNGKGGSVALAVHAESAATTSDAATPDPALGNNTASFSTTVTRK